MTAIRTDAPVHLVRGDDEVILRDATRDLVHALLGDQDRRPGRRGGRADRFRRRTSTPSSSRWSTPPRRRRSSPTAGSSSAATSTVHGRRSSPRSSATSPTRSPTTSLVLVWESGRGAQVAPRRRRAAGGGEQVDTSPGRKDARPGSTSRSAAPGLTLDRAAADRLVAVAGRGPERLVGVLGDPRRQLRRRAPGSASTTSSPFLGEAGGVPPWELTDAIDRGDIAGALGQLHRMIGGGGRHPLQVMATLHGHYARMLALDGADGHAARRTRPQLLGMKGSTFPARKALSQARRLGHDGSVEADRAAGRAPTSTCGAARRWPDDLVLEVLVARLAPRRWLGAERARLSRSAEALRDLGHQAALAAGGGVPVDDALGGGLVDALHGERAAARRRRRRRPRRRSTARLTRVFSSERTALLRSWRTRSAGCA